MLTPSPDRPAAHDELTRGWDPRFFQATLDSLDAGIAVLDENGSILAVNAVWRDSPHFAPKGGAEVGAPYLGTWEQLAAQGDETASGIALGLRAVLDGEQLSFEHEYWTGDAGRSHWLRLRARPHTSPSLAHVVLHVRDVTSQVHDRNDLELRAHLLDAVDAAVFATDLDGNVTYWSRGAEELFGWASTEALGRHIGALTIAPEHRGQEAEVTAALTHEGSWHGENELVHRDGTRFVGLTRSSVFLDGTGRPAGMVGISADITDRRRREHELREAHDYVRAVTDSIAEGVCTVDADGRVRYLNPAAEQMLGWPRDELVGRGFDDVVRPPDAEQSRGPSALICSVRDGKIHRSADEVFVRRDGTQIDVTATGAPLRAGLGGAVVVFADITARKQRQEEMERELSDLVQVNALHHALAHDRLVLFAQPIFSLSSGEVVKHELLLRMLDDNDDLVPPGVFLPAAERQGVIWEVDRWVVDQAARLAAAGHLIGINVSTSWLSRHDAFDHIARSIEVHAAEPARIVFEVTETGIIENESAVVGFLEAVRGLGCRIAIDDFGTGHAGFGRLKQIPADFLKIDIEFVRDLLTNQGSVHVVQAVVALARGFGQRVIAEGIEDGTTRERLYELGVDYGQGFGLGRPAPVTSLVGNGHAT